MLQGPGHRTTRDRGAHGVPIQSWRPAPASANFGQALAGACSRPAKRRCQKSSGLRCARATISRALAARTRSSWARSSSPCASARCACSSASSPLRATALAARAQACSTRSDIDLRSTFAEPIVPYTRMWARTTVASRRSLTHGRGDRTGVLKPLLRGGPCRRPVHTVAYERVPGRRSQKSKGLDERPLAGASANGLRSRERSTSRWWAWHNAMPLAWPSLLPPSVTAMAWCACTRSVGVAHPGTRAAPARLGQRVRTEARPRRPRAPRGMDAVRVVRTAVEPGPSTPHVRQGLSGTPLLGQLAAGHVGAHRQREVRRPPR
ncbi:MAG: hypothetical protein QOJ21_2138 [Solirubrobacteraceae bacterium]|jgi:hypothetical protein|nr:hypothetical protein [Solirubrobacteraceae bacterium]